MWICDGVMMCVGMIVGCNGGGVLVGCDEV